MQQTNPNERRKMLFQMLIIWAISIFIAQKFFAPKPPVSPAEAVGALQSARLKEKEGRKNEVPASWPASWREADAASQTPATSTPRIELAQNERIKSLESASHAYEEFGKTNIDTPDGVAASIQAINVYDYLSQLEGKTGNTHWFDQAELRLKDMQNRLHKKTGSVNFELDGKIVPQEGDLGRLSSWRLDRIRESRDTVNQTKITWKVLDFFVRLTGAAPAYSYFLALLIIVVVLKSATFPLLKKQYRMQKDMARVQPLVLEMQKQMKDRPQEEVSRRMMEIYKENNVSLASGCLPALGMMIVLWPVFWMVKDYEYRFTLGQFLWIGSPASLSNPLLGDNLAQFDAPLFFIYLLSNVLYGLIQPKPADPQQLQQQRMMLVMMPLVFGVVMWQGQWSSAFMLYWLILNLASMYQSWVVARHFGLYNQSTPAKAPTASTPPADGAKRSVEPVKRATDAVAPAVDPAAPLKPMQGVETPRAKKDRQGPPGPFGMPTRR